MLVDEAGNNVRILKRGEWKESNLQRVTFVPSPTETPIVRRIFETYAKGIGLNTIVEDLNTEKVPAPRGLHWSKSIVHFMLRNRTYLGERGYNRRSYKAYRRGEKGDLFNPKVEWISTPHAHDAIITEELFEKVAAKFTTWKKRTAGTMHRPAGKKHAPYLLTGIAVCGHCGYKLTGRPSLNSRGYGNFIYDCSGYVRCGRTVCRSMHLPTEQLDAVTVRAIRENLSNPGWQHDLEEVMATVFAEEFGDGAENRVKTLKAQILKAEREVANFVDAVRSGAFSSAIATALHDTESRLEALRIELRTAEAKARAMPSPQSLIAEAARVAQDFDKMWGIQS
jgi:site-specific DNA recombinase